MNNIQTKRRGATLIESAVVLVVLMAILWSGLEVSMAVIRFNSMSASARIIAREASVHGELSPDPWGIAPLSLSGTSSHPAAQLIAGQLPTLDPSQVTIELSWPDGDDQVGDRVMVTVRCVNSPVVNFATLALPSQLSASSRSLISH
jgi:hypothetical protein